MEFISKSSWGFATYFAPIVEVNFKLNYPEQHQRKNYKSSTCNFVLSLLLKSILFQGLVKAGYVRGSTLLGAPYDFRKAANEQGQKLINYQQEY